jgi:hypothetical protein
MPFYPSIVLRTKERASTPYSSIVFSLGLAFESLKELRVRHNEYNQNSKLSPKYFKHCCEIHSSIL